MTTIGEIIQAGYPGADEGTEEQVLWGMTPYPITRITERQLFKAASQLYRATKKGLRLCDFCDREAAHHGLCRKHGEIVSSWRDSE